MNLRCLLSGHRYVWPDHAEPASGYGLRLRVECVRGCGSRRVADCRPDRHWTNRHEEDGRVRLSEIDYFA